ncbi:hypothetical protein VP01_3199g2 [Puccinia sorghi]|uniref:BZIP domain-containing protein n=1 Tax=Puccinia sorghi TaxID=27349 RepID=A0A0L6UZA8_9BASI|nr:hypothetical protein VP01_3199g2 [Puccinia sorghi]
MADDWPFLHLNIISPPSIDRINDEQELSLLPFDSSHLEAWTNINFQFDEPPIVRFDSNSQTTTNLNINPTSSSANSDPRLPPSSSPATSEKNSNSNSVLSNPFQSPSQLQFQLTNDHAVSTLLENHNILTNTHELTYLAQSSNQPTLDSSIDNLISSNHQNIIQPISVDTHNGKPAVTHNPNKSTPHPSHHNCDKSSSPNNNNSNPSSNEDDDANRLAHDEDKRRRNTLASARFRMKKKMKEQEIERVAREMRERVADLEKQVDSLTQENKWLRGLIVDSTASKLVTVQAQDNAELTQLESSSGKRARPTLNLTGDSMHLPAQYQKRPRLSSSATSATTTSKNSIGF